MAISFDIQKSSVIDGVYIITPNKFQDLRGEIWTAFTDEALGGLVPDGVRFVHDKFITSHKNVLRGIHGDHKTYKLATCLYGKILKVIVDARLESHTYMKYEKFELSPENQQIILVPAGCGNSQLVLSDTAVYYYKCAYNGAYADADEQFTIAWNDPRLNIDWGIDKPILSARDMMEK